MKKININKVAQEVSKLEGGYTNLSIAQIKEVIRCTMTILHNNFKGSEILEMVERYWK